jgi:hypothetical protein
VLPVSNVRALVPKGGGKCMCAQRCEGSTILLGTRLPG